MIWLAFLVRTVQPMREKSLCGRLKKVCQTGPCVAASGRSQSPVLPRLAGKVNRLEKRTQSEAKSRRALLESVRLVGLVATDYQ